MIWSLHGLFWCSLISWKCCHLTITSIKKTGCDSRKLTIISYFIFYFPWKLETILNFSFHLMFCSQSFPIISNKNNVQSLSAAEAPGVVVRDSIEDILAMTFQINVELQHLNCISLEKLPPYGWFFLAPAEGCSLRLRRWGPSGPTIEPFGPT